MSEVIKTKPDKGLFPQRDGSRIHLAAGVLHSNAALL